MPRFRNPRFPDAAIPRFPGPANPGLASSRLLISDAAVVHDSAILRSSGSTTSRFRVPRCCDLILCDFGIPDPPVAPVQSQRFRGSRFRDPTNSGPGIQQGQHLRPSHLRVSRDSRLRNFVGGFATSLLDPDSPTRSCPPLRRGRAPRRAGHGRPPPPTAPRQTRATGTGRREHYPATPAAGGGGTSHPRCARTSHGGRHEQGTVRLSRGTSASA